METFLWLLFLTLFLLNILTYFRVLNWSIARICQPEVKGFTPHCHIHSIAVKWGPISVGFTIVRDIK